MVTSNVQYIMNKYTWQRDAIGNGGSSAWWNITGTVSQQSDLWTLLLGKQATLVSWANIKTINWYSLLGSGNITISWWVITLTPWVWISIWWAYPNFTIDNTLPDQTVVLTPWTNIDSITGTYPNFTINASNQWWVTDHSLLSNLDYASSWHIGFQEDLDKREERIEPYSYLFTAPVGSLETDPVWLGNRLTITADGNSTTSTLVNVRWTDRLTLPF